MPAKNIAAGLCLLLVSLVAAASDCSDATDRYNSAIEQISYTMKRYASCVSNSQGHDDCSSEFRRLKNAQSDFESVVSEVQSYCDE